MEDPNNPNQQSTEPPASEADLAPFVFLDGIDENNVTQEIWVTINKLFSYISQLVNFKYHLIMYRLLKKGYVKPSQLAEVSGYSRQRLNKIVNDFEKRETARQAETETQ